MFDTENTPFDAAPPVNDAARDDNSLLANAALGLAVEQMNIVVVDPSRTMQTILRSMIQQMRPKRLRVYDSAVAALRDMIVEPPNLVLCEWKMEHMSGHGLIKIMRHQSMAPLCAVPIIVITGSATRSAVEGALRVGAHAVLVKPLSPAILRQRIEWIARDDRALVALDSQYVIDGVNTALDAQRAKDRLPSIIQQMRSSEQASQAKPDPEEAEVDQAAPAAKQKITPLDQADKAKIIKGLERSPTLDRLLRQRAKVAGENEARARAARQVSREKIELKTSKRQPAGSGLSRWKDIWGG
ncbi:MAG: response regulator [Hyphomicrobiales bacterium]|nr:response regulator [Hyphomicrobiales bacterium]OQW83839.1 MAG: hypothetical protein BVN31_05135 [Proteobacteria bacterium ST_bin15]